MNQIYSISKIFITN